MATFLDEPNPRMQMKKFKELMHNVSVNPLWMNKQKQAAQRWNPYSFEGGLVTFRGVFFRA